MNDSLLGTLLGTESLLFAGFTLAVSLAQRTAFGARPVLRPWVLAVGATGGLSIVAVGAGAAWWDYYACAALFDGPSATLQALALAVAIVGQPILAALIAAGVYRSSH